MRVQLKTIIPPVFWPVHQAIRRGAAREVVAKGGRGSGKSSYLSVELVYQLLRHPRCHAVVLRKVAGTLRNSVYNQVVWAIGQLGCARYFRCTVSPMECTYLPTGQKILFFGLDDAGKLKSIKVPFGSVGLCWFEELDQFDGPEEVRNVEQSILRAMLPVQRSMDNFILAATQAQVEGVDRIVQLFLQRMNVVLDHEFDDLRGVLRETSEEQRKAQQDMRAAAEAIAQMTQDVVNMHQLSQGVLEHFRDYVADMDASRAHVEETNRKTLELLAAMNKTSGQQAMYLAKLQDYQAALTANQQQYAAWTDRFLNHAQEQTRVTAGEMDRVVKELHESAQALSSSGETFVRQTQESMAKTTALFDESISASIRQMNETLGVMRETTRTMPQLLSQSRERYAEQVDQFVTALVRLQKGAGEEV